MDRSHNITRQGILSVALLKFIGSRAKSKMQAPEQLNMQTHVKHLANPRAPATLMCVDSPKYPFIDEFLRERTGTLYLLSNSSIRPRDSVGALNIVYLFAKCGVAVDVFLVEATQRRYLSEEDVTKAWQSASDEQKGRIDESPEVEQKVKTLFHHAKRTSSPETTFESNRSWWIMGASRFFWR